MTTPSQHRPAPPRARARRHRALAGAALLALTALLAGACADPEPPSLFADGRVAVGVKNDQPGTGQETSYKFAGFDITVARQVLAGVHAEPDFSSVPSQDRSTVLTHHQKDLVIATYSITDERMKAVDFVGPYATTSQGVMIREDEAGTIRSRQDLKHKRVCTWEGTTSGKELDKPAYDDIEDYPQQDASLCIKDLEEGRADAVSTDQMILYGFTQEKDSHLKVVPGILFGSSNEYGIAMAKGHRADCRRLRDALRAYITSTAWEQDFANSLPAIKEQEPHWQTDFKPSTESIDRLSCRDHPAA
ncbi:transporter substrate-binding domain-containing protein [Streptomyces pinistramenti]|uniref:transporter substrate-binding domain-containing protein n=1 Tax=Streptomyces pinistramenti TaxID=2884812 RepID=UPI001D0840A9|nr:transporter substrate-binding domain-containing protein [Streptomyces pinistramenti]MCB5908227.1 transporter substrate-binding domain-containing protein [Streptomyces pinistramenti]